MPVLNDLAQFIRMTEKISPKCRKSLLWRRARDSVLRSAVRSDLLTRWCDEVEIDEFQDELSDELDYESELDAIVDRALGRPPRTKK